LSLAIFLNYSYILAILSLNILIDFILIKKKSVYTLLAEEGTITDHFPFVHLPKASNVAMSLYFSSRFDVPGTVMTLPTGDLRV